MGKSKRREFLLGAASDLRYAFRVGGIVKSAPDVRTVCSVRARQRPIYSGPLAFWGSCEEPFVFLFPALLGDGARFHPALGVSRRLKLQRALLTKLFPPVSRIHPAHPHFRPAVERAIFFLRAAKMVNRRDRLSTSGARSLITHEKHITLVTSIVKPFLRRGCGKPVDN